MINEEENNKMTKSSVCSRQDDAADDARRGRRQGRITCNQEYLNNNLNGGQSQNGSAALARLLDSTSSAVEAEKATSSSGDDKITVVDDQLYSANFDDEAEAASEKEEEEMMMRRQVNSMLENTASQLYSLPPPPSSSLVNGLTSVTDEARLRASPAPLSSQPPLNLSLQSHSHVKSTLSRDGFVTNKRYQTLRDNMHSQSQLTSCYDEVYQVADEEEEDEDDDELDEEEYEYFYERSQDSDFDRDALSLQDENIESVINGVVSSSSSSSYKKKLDDLIENYRRENVLNGIDLIDGDNSLTGEIRSSSSSLSTPEDAKVSNNLSAYMSNEARSLTCQLRNEKSDSNERSKKEYKVEDPVEFLGGVVDKLKDNLRSKNSAVAAFPATPYAVGRTTSIQFNNYDNAGSSVDSDEEEKELDESEDETSIEDLGKTQNSYLRRDLIPASTSSNISKISMELNMIASSVDEAASQLKSSNKSDKNLSRPVAKERSAEDERVENRNQTPEKSRKALKKQTKQEAQKINKLEKSPTDVKNSSDPIKDFKPDQGMDQLGLKLIEQRALSSPSRNIPKPGASTYHSRFPTLVYDVTNSTPSSSRHILDSKCDSTLPPSNVEPAPSKTNAKTTKKSNRTNKSTANGPNSSLQSSANADNNEERQKYSQHYSEDLNELLSFIESSAPAQTSQQSEESKKSKKKPKNKKKNEPSVVQQQTASAESVPAPPVKTSASSDTTQQTYSQSNSSSSVSTNTSKESREENKAQITETYETTTSEAINEEEFVTVTRKTTKSRKQNKQTECKKKDSNFSLKIAKKENQPKPLEDSNMYQVLAKQMSSKSINSSSANFAVDFRPDDNLSLKISENSLDDLTTSSNVPQNVEAMSNKDAQQIENLVDKQENDSSKATVNKNEDQSNVANEVSTVEDQHNIVEEGKSASSSSLETNISRKSKKYEYLIKRNSSSVVFLDELSKKDAECTKNADSNKQDQTTPKALEGISFGFLSSESDSEQKNIVQKTEQPSNYINTTTSSSLVIRKDKQRKLKTKTKSKTSAKTPNESEISSGIERRHSSSNDSNVSSTPSRSSSSDSKDDSNQYHPTRSNKQRLKRSQRTNKASFRYKYAPDGGNKEDDDCSTADETNYSNVYSHQSYSVVSEEKSHDQDAAYMDGFDESENQMDDKEQAYMHSGHYYSPQHIIPPPLQAPLQGHQVPYMAYAPSHGQIYPPGVDAPPLPPHQLMNMPGYPAYVPASYNPAQMAPQPNHAVANTTAAYAYNQQVHLASYQTIQASYQANYAYVPHPSAMPGQPQPNYVQPVPYYVQPMQAVQGGHPAAPYFVYRPVAHYPTAPAVAASNSQHHHAYYQQYYNYPMYQNYVQANDELQDVDNSALPAISNVESSENSLQT